MCIYAYIYICIYTHETRYGQRRFCTGVWTFIGLWYPEIEPLKEPEGTWSLTEAGTAPPKVIQF